MEFRSMQFRCFERHPHSLSIYSMSNISPPVTVLIRGATELGDRPKGGGVWGESQFLAGKNWKNSKFWRRRRQYF